MVGTYDEIKVRKLYSHCMPIQYTVYAYMLNYTGMFPVGDTSSKTLIAVCVCVCVCVCVSVCPPTYRYIAPRMIQRIILKFCGYVGCDDATNVSNFGYEPIKFNQLNQ